MRKKDRRSAGMKRVSEIPNYNALVKIIMKLGLVWLQGGIKCASQRAGLIDSEDPKHTLFRRETAFVAIYALFQG